MFRKAPPAVDQALRARITAFMQAHVEGRFRQAEQYVAEDTKDFFYASNKPKYLSFEIRSIDYSGEFTRAKATVVAEMQVPMPQLAGKTMKMPFASYWKVEKNDWFWYVDQAQLRSSPFGQMRPGPPVSGAGAPGIPSAMPSADEATKELWSKVKLDRQVLDLSPGGSGGVSISNGMPGPISLSVEGTPAGVTASLEHTDLAAGGKSVLTVSATAQWAARPGSVNIRVSPSNQLLVVRVRPQASK